MAPVCTILGGANGAGKSSLFNKFRPVGVFVNADSMARAIDPAHPEQASVAAGRAVIEHLRTLIGERRDFVYETTPSSRQSVNLLRRAQDTGYEVGLVFVVLADPDLHVERVADKVRKRRYYTMTDEAGQYRHLYAEFTAATASPGTARASTWTARFTRTRLKAPSPCSRAT